MKVIKGKTTGRVTTLEFGDKELQVIEACLDYVTDRDDDDRVQGSMSLWNEFSTLCDDLSLTTVEVDGSDSVTDDIAE